MRAKLPVCSSHVLALTAGGACQERARVRLAGSRLPGAVEGIPGRGKQVHQKRGGQPVKGGSIRAAQGHGTGHPTGAAP